MSYIAAIRDDFAFLKSTTTIEELTARSIPLEGGAGMLVPVCELHTDDERLISKLGAWREENAFAFPTQFPVTRAGTTRWLRTAVLDVPGRILFLVQDRFGHTVGHLGYANADSDDRSMEIDNVVRGEKNVQPGLMAAALAGVIDWAESSFGPHGSTSGARR